MSELSECELEAVRRATSVLMSGCLAVFPTETVYGVAAHPDVPGARERLFEAKGRDRDKPIQMLIADTDCAKEGEWAMCDAALKLALQFWPGPLTMVVDAGNSTRGLRVPDHPVAQALLRECGGRLWASSANMSGEPAAASAAEAAAVLGDSVKATLDCGPSPAGKASTVLRITSGQVTMLREGEILESEITKCLAR